MCRVRLVLAILFSGVLILRVLWCGVTYPGSTIYILLLLGSLLAAEIAVAAFTGRGLRCSPPDVFFILYFLVVLLMAVLRGPRWRGADFLFQCAGCTAAYFLGRHLSDDRPGRIAIATGLLAGALLVALYGLYQSLWGLAEARDLLAGTLASGERGAAFMSRALSRAVFSTFFYPNALAGYLIVAIPFAVSILFWKADQARDAAAGTYLVALACAYAACAFFRDLAARPLLLVVLFAAVAALAAGLAVTERGGRRFRLKLCCLPLSILPVLALSRTLAEGAWCALGAAVILCVFAFLGARWRIAIFLCVLLGAAAVVSLRHMIPQEMGDSFGARCDYWRAAVEIWRRHPFLGAGVGSFPGLYPLFRLPGSEEGRMAHSAYLGLAAETGIVGLAAFLCMWGSCIASLWGGAKRRNPIAIAVLVSGIAFLLHGIMDVDLNVPGITLTIWALAGVALSSGEADRSPCRIPVVPGLLLGGVILFATISLVLPCARAEWHRMTAERLEIAGMSDRALSEMCDVIPHEDDNPAYWSLLGDMLERSGGTEQSLQARTMAVQYGEGIAAYHFKLAAGYWRASKEGRNPERSLAAIGEMNRAIHRNPHDLDYRLLLAYWYEKTGKSHEALQEFTRGLDLIHELLRAPRRIRRHTHAEYQTLEKLVSERVNELRGHSL